MALLFCQDFSGTLYDPASNNRGALNLFWFPDPEGQYGRFGWANKAMGFLSAFNATPGGGGNSRYMSDGERTKPCRRPASLQNRLHRGPGPRRPRGASA
jgi:hypothetical protein